ncbi:MAG TPA: hypothetical protein DCY80_09780 [Solibacterales bacterium]|nr:hypothetical protein [Bryobacterales bacterium]
MPCMDRRRHPRFPVNTPVRLTTLLGEAVTADARLEQLSGAGARIVSPIALPAGTPLRLDLPDTLLLGECVHCQPDGDRFSLGVHLEHSLGCLGELRRLMSALVRETQPPSPSSRVA